MSFKVKDSENSRSTLLKQREPPILDVQYRKRPVGERSRARFLKLSAGSSTYFTHQAAHAVGELLSVLKVSTNHLVANDVSMMAH